ILPLALPRLDPADAGHVGNRIVSGEEGPVGQSLVHDAIEPLGLAGVAVDGVFDGFRRIAAKMMGLAGHRAETPNLPEQPLLDLDALALVSGIEAASLTAEILQDR